jgi:uncharacterized phage protein (TIGR01671 family)
MREIKFRGMNSKGEWVFGDLLRNRGETFIAPDGIQNPLATANDFRCDERTVGQFTGLYDKNGKEIYEGDIVKTHMPDETGYIIGEVEYDNDNACYVVKCKVFHEYTTIDFSHFDDFYILDNIHENKELLKGV